MSRSGPKVVIGGGLRLDYIISRDNQAHVGLLGGNAVYGAVGASIWDDEVGIWAKAGRNYPRQKIRQLEQAGFHCDGLILLDDEQEHRTFYAYTHGKRVDSAPERHFKLTGLPFPNDLEGYIDSTPGQDDLERYEPLALRPEDWPSAYGICQAVHLAPLTIRTHMYVPRYLRQIGVRIITVDPGERYMRPDMTEAVKSFLPDVDVFLPSNEEVKTLFGQSIELLEAARELGSWGAKIVIVKLGKSGVLVYDSASADYWELPAFFSSGQENVVDVTGAGDAFCGGFVVGFVKGLSPLQSALQGMVSASVAVESYGALSGLQFSMDMRDMRFSNLLRRLEK